MHPCYEIEAWNSHFPVGTPVELTDDEGNIHKTHTRSVAWVLSGGTPVIKVHGRSGSYRLDRIKAVRGA